MKGELLYPASCRLGESPTWHPERNCCYWVDIEGKEVYEMNWGSRKVVRYQLPERVSLVVPGKNDDLIVAMQGGVSRLKTGKRSLELITDLGIDWHNLRFNDGIADSRGRLWIGTMDLDQRRGAGTVYRIDRSGKAEGKIERVTISNGMAWSPDNLRLYYTDSITRSVSSFIYEEGTGEIQFEKTAIRIPAQRGLPDGMAMDAEGKLWIALWDGFGVGRFDPLTGQMNGFIEVPAPHVTSCCFAGPGLDQLIITTAREGLTEEEAGRYPCSGHVFIAEAGVSGVAGFRCGL